MDDKEENSKCNFKHLSEEKREKILELLVEGKNCSQISQELEMSASSISREIKRNRDFKVDTYKRNKCVYVQTCKIKKLCRENCPEKYCKQCSFNVDCTKICHDYKPTICKRLIKFPFVCNGCKEKFKCRLDKYFYVPKNAHKKYIEVLKESRKGIDLSEDEFARLDEIVTKGTINGQSIEHISTYGNFQVSSRTVRRYISKGFTTVKPIDTPRGLTYKPRKKIVTKEYAAEIKRAKEGRGYADFMKYALEKPMLFYAQLDTVEGLKGESAKLMTLILVNPRIFFCFPIKDGSMASIKAVFDSIYSKLGHSTYTKFFSLILTDNGTEFSRPMDIEVDTNTGEIKSRVFFCNPYASWEKGAIENCHELLRRICPKGSSFANINDNKASLINSHINSYRRKANDNLSPYESFIEIYGDSAKLVLEKLGVRLIKPDSVNLTPNLLK